MKHRILILAAVLVTGSVVLAGYDWLAGSIGVQRALDVLDVSVAKSISLAGQFVIHYNAPFILVGIVLIAKAAFGNRESSSP